MDASGAFDLAGGNPDGGHVADVPAGVAMSVYADEEVTAGEGRRRGGDGAAAVPGDDEAVRGERGEGGLHHARGRTEGPLEFRVRGNIHLPNHIHDLLVFVETHTLGNAGFYDFFRINVNHRFRS